MSIARFMGLCLLTAPTLAYSAPLASTPQTQTATLIAALPECSATNLSLVFDGENGGFNGMMHSGTRVILRNLGPAACRIDALSALVFIDGRGRRIDTRFSLDANRAVRPVGLASGAAASAILRWVSGDAYENGRCASANALQVGIDGSSTKHRLTAHLCGPVDEPIAVTRTPLTLDPVLRPTSAP